MSGIFRNAWPIFSTLISITSNALKVACSRALLLRVRQFADEIIAERGVRHGQLNLISVDLGKAHRHGGPAHRHLKPAD
jgi:CopG family nickel-responsive transcriptional regulator